MSANASFSNNHSHILGTALHRINHVQKLYVLFQEEMRKSDSPKTCNYKQEKEVGDVMAKVKADHVCIRNPVLREV